MLKNILIGIFAAVLVVALGTGFYNVAIVEAANGNLLSELFGRKEVNQRLTMLEGFPITEITDAEALALLKTASFSRMVEDVELNAITKWEIDVKRNSDADQPTIAADLSFLFDRYNIIDPNSGETGIYTDLDVFSAYQVSSALIDQDKPSAIKGIAYAYEMLLQATFDALDITDNEDFLYVYQFILNQDTNHFKSWVTLYQAETGEKYLPQLLSQDLFEGLMTGTAGKNPQPVETPILPEEEVDENTALAPTVIPSGNSQGRGQGQQGSGMFTNEVLTLHGELLAYEYGTLTISSDEGGTITASIGNQEYADTIGFYPTVGETMTITGSIDPDGIFVVSTVELDQSGILFTFRSSTGRPSWAGGNGKGGGNK